MAGVIRRTFRRAHSERGKAPIHRALIEALETRSLLSATQLLPDMVPWGNETKGFLYGWQIDTEQVAGHTLLRLTTASSNLGSGPMEVGGGAVNPDGVTQQVFQRIYNSDGTFTDRVAGNFVYH